MAGGGVGEAMLLGAAMGGGSAAITGGDPLKGALFGAATGGIGGSLGGAAAGAEGAAAGSATGSMAPTVANAQALQAANSMAPTLANAQAMQSAALPGLGTGTFSTAPDVLAKTVVPSVTPGAGLYTPPSGITSLPNAVGPNLFANPLDYIKANPFTTGASAIAGAVGGRPEPYRPEEYRGPLRRFQFNPDTYRATPYAAGGITDLAAGGYDKMVGEQPMYQAMASGGISSLGSYSDGGRMLKGPGDGMSDSIPATISNKRPARLADGEFVVPADVVSHLGNGSTDAGAKQLYAMMDKVRSARTGRKAQGREINPRKYMPA